MTPRESLRIKLHEFINGLSIEENDIFFSLLYPELTKTQNNFFYSDDYEVEVLEVYNNETETWIPYVEN